MELEANNSRSLGTGEKLKKLDIEKFTHARLEEMITTQRKASWQTVSYINPNTGTYKSCLGGGVIEGKTHSRGRRTKKGHIRMGKWGVSAQGG